MPALTPKNQPVAPTPVPVQIADKSFRGVTVDTRYTPIRNILQYIEGSQWKVRYYSQVLARDSELSPQQVNLSPVYQQYRAIDDFLLSVSSTLDLSQEEDSKSMSAQGSATMYPGLIPNTGDMFLADIGDGQEGIFAVTNSTKLTHLKDSMYNIEYNLVAISDDDPLRLEDLNNKVIEELVYVRDYLAVGEKPLITKTDFVRRDDMAVVLAEIVDQYFQDFYSRELSTLLVPDQPLRTYDPFLTAFVRDLVEINEQRLVSSVDLPEVYSIPGMRQQTIWDAIRRLSKPMLRSIARRMGVLSSVYYRGQPHYSGVFYTGVELVVYPLDPRTDPDVAFNSCIPSPTGAIVNDGNVRRGALEDYLKQPVHGFTYRTPMENSLPYVVPVAEDGNYVFTAAFYNGEGKLSSQLERLTLQMLGHEPIEKDMVLSLAREANKWPNLERFYYVPVVIALLKVSIRTS